MMSLVILNSLVKFVMVYSTIIILTIVGQFLITTKVWIAFINGFTQ